jgi:D-alanyl-D-alanine-carboxypeptidase/D-alanyl-D-alanine-endopeptidase
VGLLDASGERYVSVGLRETGKAAMVDPDTVFEIGSISKAFTGMILAQEVVAGRLDLGKPANDYLPAGMKLPDGPRPITLADLATHTSGVPRMGEFTRADPRNPYSKYGTEELAKAVNALKLESDPGKTSSYSNLGFMVLSHLLVTRSGKASFEELARERLMCPLAMAACKAGASESATPHDPRLQPTPMWDFGPTVGGVGALRMSARDLMRAAAANLGDGGSLGAALAEARKAHWSQGDTRAVGLGWQIRKRGERTIYWHNGGTGGTRSFMGFDRTAQAAVVVLGNSNQDVTALGLHLLDPEGSPYQAPVKVDAAAVAAVAGEYDIDGKPGLWVMRAGERMMARLEGGAVATLEPSSSTRFASLGNSLVLERQGEGAPVTLQVTSGGKTVTAVQRERKAPVKLTAEQMQPLVGTYRAGPREFTVSIEGANLVVSAGGQRVPLVAESPTEFVVTPLTIRVRFTPEGELHWTQLGTTAVAKR